MKPYLALWVGIILLVLFFLAGCTTSGAAPSGSTAIIPDYTAAAQTIAAQLTEIAGPGAVQATIIPNSEKLASATPITATESLPDTSTPLPSKTPLLSNPLTITQTSTVVPVATGSPAPPLSPGDPKAGLGDPDFSDDFEDGSNWYIYNDEHVNIEVQDSELSMTALNADKYEAMMLSTLPIITDFYMEVTATTGDCSGLDRYGLIFRAPGFTPIQGYLFGFTCDGMYSLRVFDGINFTALVQWTLNESIHAGPQQTNILGIAATGQQLTLSANGQPLLEIQDDRFSSGYFGLFVSAYNTPGFQVSYSDFAYWLQP